MAHENTYVNDMTNKIDTSIYRIFDNLVYTLKQYYWKENTKPNDQCLQAVLDASTKYEDIYERYFKTHLTVLRKLNLHCSISLSHLNDYQVYKRKGMLHLIKMKYPHVGKTSRPKDETTSSLPIEGSLGSYTTKIDADFFGQIKSEPVQYKRTAVKKTQNPATYFGLDEVIAPAPRMGINEYMAAIHKITNNNQEEEVSPISPSVEPEHEFYPEPQKIAVPKYTWENGRVRRVDKLK